MTHNVSLSQFPLGKLAIGRHVQVDKMASSAPLPEFQHPSHALLSAQGFNHILYSEFRDRCLAERAKLGEPVLQHLCSWTYEAIVHDCRACAPARYDLCCCSADC